MWIKKSGDPDFEVIMKSFDGAELCELLYTIAKEYGLITTGLYRDDGLWYFHNISGPKSEKRKISLTFLKINSILTSLSDLI